MMKHRIFRDWLLIVSAITPYLYLPAGVPLPSVCLYGTVRDAYGYPYTEDAEVVLQKDEIEYVRYQITGELTPGVNCRMELEMDSGGTPYESYAAHVGDELEIKVLYQGDELGVMTNACNGFSANLTVPAAGSNVRLDLQTGTDADGDGLPDAWEQMLIQQSGGALSTLQDVKADDDFDGDGSSNRHEFQSGTFPFLAYDRFAMDDLERTSTGRFSFSFLAVAGFTYQVHGATALQGPAWGEIPFASDPEAELSIGYIFGDDTFKTLYLESTNQTAFVKLTIK